MRAGVPLSVTFVEPMNTQQQAWLRSTTIPLRSIAFCSGETASHHVYEQVCSLSS